MKNSVCLCLKLTKDDLYQSYQGLKNKNVRELMFLTKAGTRCGACVTPQPETKEKRSWFLQHLCDEWDKEIQRNEHFSNSSLIKKMQMIEDCLETVVRPELKKDQGHVELFHFEDDVVYLDYQGQCRSCQSSEQQTAQWIEEKLQIWCGFSLLKVGIVQHIQ
jgi:Fe-S cluster biogenesis protein NfuA